MSTKVELMIHKTVAKTFGIKIDNRGRPLRDNQGNVKTKKPRVPAHIQKKFVKFLDVVELKGKIRPVDLRGEGFEPQGVEMSKYYKWALQIAKNLIFGVLGVSLADEEFRIFKIKLSRDYRITLAITHDGSKTIIYVLVVDGGKREDYYQ